MKRALLVAVAALVPVVVLAQTAPDLIIHHAKVFTGDPAHRFAEAVAIQDNKIVAVGTNAAITAMAGETTNRIDAGGRGVVPGFNDAHTHQGPRPEGFSLSLDQEGACPLAGPAFLTATEETPGDGGASAPTGPNPPPDPAVTAQALDKAAPHMKVMLTSWTGHGVIMN